MTGCQVPHNHICHIPRKSMRKLVGKMGDHWGKSSPQHTLPSPSALTMPGIYATPCTLLDLCSTSHASSCTLLDPHSTSCALHIPSLTYVLPPAYSLASPCIILTCAVPLMDASTPSLTCMRPLAHSHLHTSTHALLHTLLDLCGIPAHIS